MICCGDVLLFFVWGGLVLDQKRLQVPQVGMLATYCSLFLKVFWCSIGVVLLG